MENKSVLLRILGQTKACGGFKCTVGVTSPSGHLTPDQHSSLTICLQRARVDLVGHASSMQAKSTVRGDEVLVMRPKADEWVAGRGRWSGLLGCISEKGKMVSWTFPDGSD